MSTTNPATRVSEPRERLLRTASDLFYREGIHSVGVDRIVAAANVTRATFYRHFPSKEDLVEAYLGVEHEFIRAMFDRAAATGAAGRELVEIVIEGFADDIERNHTRGCPFINAAAEYPDPKSPVRRTIVTNRAWFRAILEEALRGADVPDAVEAAAELVLLRDAALVGGYLDGWPTVRPAFIRAARRAVGVS